jgi:uncharacterized SAM-binding protein YcdF (DUF218 family)
MKSFLKTTAYLILSVTIIAALGYASLGLLLSLPGSKPQRADVIIVLGGDNGLRVRKGAELYLAGYASHILLTGIDKRYYRPNHPDWRERRMKELGIPKKAIRIDTGSQTTWEEAVNASAIMEKKGWKKAIVVSDPPHMLRLSQTWRKAFSGTSRRFVLVPTNPEWWQPLFWWKNKTSCRFVINEIKKNLFYAVLYY